MNKAQLTGMNTLGNFSNGHFMGKSNDIMESFTMSRIKFIGLGVGYIQSGYFFEQPSEQLKFISFFIRNFFDQMGGEQFFGNSLVNYILFGVDGHLHTSF